MSRKKDSPTDRSSPRGVLLEGWLLHYFLLLAIGVVVVFIAALPAGKIISYRREASEMRQEAARLHREAALLRERAGQARSPVVIERTARERLGLARPEEVVFVPIEGPWPEPALGDNRTKKDVTKKKPQSPPAATPTPTPSAKASAPPTPRSPASASPKPSQSR
jgi:cell division protein FtsB